MSKTLQVLDRRVRFDGDYHARALGAEATDQGASGNGRLEGVASRTGVLDSYGSVLATNAFEGVIPDFLAHGALLMGHDYSGAPIGYPVEAEIRGRDLFVASEYHSSERAQEARTVAQERMAAGKRVGLSIGFRIDTYMWFDDGQQLLDAVASFGGDLSLYDVDAIRAEEDWVWLITRLKRLYEYSQVTFPSNEQSAATEVRQSRGSEGKVEPDRGDVLMARANALKLPLGRDVAAMFERAERLRSS